MAINATVGAELTHGQPVNLRDGLVYEDGTAADLDDGVNYLIQNTGGQTIKVADRTDAQGMPKTSTPATMVLPPGLDRTITLKSNSTIWVWVSSGTSSLGVTEAT